MSAHSPGPWTYCPADGECQCGLIWDASGDFVVARCVLEDDNHKKARGTHRADMRLVSAAPELYEALKRLLEATGVGHHSTSCVCEPCAEYDSVTALIKRIETPAARPGPACPAPTPEPTR